jgi:dTDP-4-amino-4,6-dideoxygalactose transaminase
LIPYNRQTIEQDDIDAVTRVLTSDRLTGGPVVEEFESKLAEYTGYRYAITVSNGTAALDIIYRWLAKLHTELTSLCVKTTPLTYLATSSAAYRDNDNIYVAYEDIDEITLNMQVPLDTENYVLLPVDFGGLPCRKFDTVKNAKVIVDSAHSIGARLSNAPYARTFSFHPVKNITTGEGGAIVTNDKDLCEYAKCFRDNGRENLNDSKFIGTNYKLSAISAALGISQLKKINSFINIRREIASRYRSELPCCLRLPYWSEDHGWHLYVIRHNRRDEIKERLRAEGIESVINYRLVYEHTSLSSFRPRDPLPNAEKASKEVLSIPIYPTMTDEIQTYVIDKITAICKELKL